MITITRYSGGGREAIFGSLAQGPDISAAVRDIIEAVRLEGDTALFRYTELFDGARLETLRVSDQEMEEARSAVEPRLLEVMAQAARNIETFHRRQLRGSFILDPRPGVTSGQKVVPIRRVGLYVPGGTAAYPSSVLMNAIPAKIAGCGEIVMVTPPGKDGKINPAILAAAGVAGVDTVCKLGGAQAIAALAYGTQSIDSVSKIVGPGNAYVAEAKRQVFGRVAIDMIAGPSEILIIADSLSDPHHLAADLLSQAEHDKMATALLITPDAELAFRVQMELERQLALLPRQEIARASIETRGRIILVKSLEEAIALSNDIAPEHLELQVEQPFDWLPKVQNAGSVFLGRHCPEAMGDYYAGANHTLPTGGTAKFSSPLSVDDFVKKIQFCYYTREALQREGDDVAYYAKQEGLDAHARSVLCRLEEGIL
jgi:histidinol dehydrogenase